jgi:hypothetical protein
MLFLVYVLANLFFALLLWGAMMSETCPPNVVILTTGYAALNIVVAMKVAAGIFGKPK